MQNNHACRKEFSFLYYCHNLACGKIILGLISITINSKHNGKYTLYHRADPHHRMANWFCWLSRWRDNSCFISTRNNLSAA